MANNLTNHFPARTFAQQESINISVKPRCLFPINDYGPGESLLHFAEFVYFGVLKPCVYLNPGVYMSPDEYVQYV